MPGGIPISPFPIIAPVGSVVAWLKSYTNTPALPAGWVECNGQTLSDADSVYNGQAIPNLNGDNRFLRGNSTSSGTGGAATVTLIVNQMPNHTHDINMTQNEGNDNFINAIPAGAGAGSAITTGATGNNEAHENLPPYYNVIWIMRVK